MTNWLKQEIHDFTDKTDTLLISAKSRLMSDAIYNILLRKVVILDNGRFFRSADIVVNTIIVDGFPDMKSETPFWAEQFSFSGIQDNTTLSIDEQNGVLIYRGRPREFLNFYLLVTRDLTSTRNFVKKLKENFVAEGLGNIVGAAIPIIIGDPSRVSGEVFRRLVTKAIDTTFAFFIDKGDKIIATYYSSLIKEKNYGEGINPKDFPPNMNNCNEAMEFAYEIISDKSE